MKKHRNTKYRNVIGQKFGRLTVISENRVIKIYKGKKVNVFMVKCKCNCGKETIVSKGSITTGNTTSCGCYRHDNLSDISKKYHTLPRGTAAFNALYCQYKGGAKYRNLTWDISKEDFKKITSSNCFYCNSTPAQSAHKKMDRRYYVHIEKYNGDYFYNGLDRVDSNKGYSINNVVPCCKRCNRGKMDIDVLEFYEWIIRTYSFLKSKNFQLPTGTSFKNPSGDPLMSISPDSNMAKQSFSVT